MRTIERTVLARRPAFLLLLAALPLLSGCLVIEKKSLVLVVPPDSKKMHLFYVYEGLSCLARPDGSLDRAVRGLDSLKKNDLSFFILTDNGPPAADDPFLKHFRFQPLHFYKDPTRKRSLCAYRQVTVTDRDAFAKVVNEAISKAVREQFTQTPEQALENVKQLNKERDKNQEQADNLGMGALYKAATTLAQIAEKFDKRSFEAIKTAVAKDTYPWLMFDKETLRLNVPITRGGAQRILDDSSVPDWMKELRALVEPVDLEPGVRGLALVLGARDKAIKLVYSDHRPVVAEHEDAMLRAAGNPGPLMIKGKAAGAAQLIERFLEDIRKK